MGSLQNKIDFVAALWVDGANPNGDPLNGNRPRTTVGGYGEISDVCIKRKIRNRLQDMGQRIFVQSADRADDGMRSLRERAEPVIARAGKDADAFMREACAEWLDVRMFGQLFAFRSNAIDGVSLGVRGPVSVRPDFSVLPVDITSMQITKSVNSETSEKKGSDTMGMRHRVYHGMYVLRGSISPQLAARTGFSDEDAELLKEALRTLFANDVSSGRPDGSMRVVELAWWRHGCAGGQYSSAMVHDSFKVVPNKDDPRDPADYDIVIERLEGLEPEVFEGR